ncbi:MAG: host specificity factor TipJ family phage tail protein [Pseudomonadota bacterium]|nr:host specificity factor TipJ family phage tail protein [Pseudomonadota bacterium]
MDSGTQSGSTIRSSLTGSQNRANPYGVIPRVYGNPRWFPPKAGNDVTESAGDDQYLRMLLCLGYGPLEVAGHRVGPGLPRLSNAEVGNAIRIGETNLGEYDEVDWEIGTRDQLTLYTQDIVEEVPGVALDLQDRTTGDKLLSSQDDVSAVRTTAVDATEISVDVVWPSGLYAMTSKGDMSPVNVEMRIEQREVGQSEWVIKRSVIVSSESKTTVRKNWRWGVPKGQYDVRVTRVRTDGPNREAVVSDAQWSALRTIQGDNEAYGNDRHVLMALRIRATDQLNGVVDQLSIRTQSVLRVWNGESFTLEATNNPAWAYLDALTGEQVPRPITDAQINLPEIQAWAAFCDEAGLGYSWVHDGNETLFQRCRAIASTGQGSFSLQDGLYGIVRDSPSEPVTQMITPRNASNVRASRQFRKLPHGIRVKYVDFETGAATGTDAELIVYRDGFTDQNATIFEDFETQGVTSATEAAFQGNYYLRQAILRPETFTVDMDWENLAAVRGNRCSLASDVLKVGLASARISSIDDINNRITLDSEVEYTTERQYGLRVRQQDGEQVLIPVTADEVGYVDTLSIGGEAYDLQPGDLVTYGVLDRETIDTKITRVDPGPDFTATLTLVPAAIDIYDFANDPIYDPGITNPIDPNQVAPPAPVITSARGDSTAASRNADGSYRTLIRVSYIFPVRVGSPTVQVEARYRLLSNPQWSHAGPFPATGSLAIADIEQHAEYVIQVRARNRDRVSAWSAEVSLDVTGHAAIAPTGVDVEIGTFSVTLRPVTIYAGSLFRFYRSAVELQPSQVESGAINLGVAAVMVDTDLQPGTDYWYYVQAYTVYSSSEFYVLKVTTREDFDAIIGAIDDELRRPGGLVDQFQSGINDNAGAIDAAREEFETGLTEANTAISNAQGRIDEIEPIVEQAATVVEDVNTLEARVGGNEAEITEARRIAELNGKLEALTSAVSATQNAVGAATQTVETLTRISDDEALAQRITTLDVSFGESVATLTQQLTTLADDTQAISDSLDSLTAEVGDSSADFEQRITALATETSAITQSVQSLQSQLGDAVASIDEVQQTQILDGIYSALQNAVVQTQSGVGSAVINVERLTSVSERNALAQQITDVSVEKDNQIAQVQQELSAVYDPSTGAVAQAVTTVNVNGKKAMIGMQVDGQTAEIVAVANTFAVLNPVSNELVTAFVVTDGRVIIPEALIDSLVVTKLRSTNGSLVFDGDKLKADYIDADNLKVKWANVQNIVIRWADIQGVKIQTADIDDLAVTTQKIGDQAVTFPNGAYTDGGKWVADGGVGADNWMDVQTLTVGSTGAPTEIKISFAYEAQFEGYVYARVLRNGSVIWYSWVDKGLLEHQYRSSQSPDVVNRVPARGHASMILLVNPPSGNSTYKLQIGPEAGGGGVTVSRRYIGTLELKK